jgi:hypothetical protein
VRFSTPNRSLALVGVTARNSYVTVGPDEVGVQMGWAFQLRAPRSSVSGAEPDHDRVLGWGVHGWRGEWLVNGSSLGLVRIRFAPAARGRTTGFPVKVHTLRVSVADPVGLVARLTGGHAAGAAEAE